MSDESHNHQLLIGAAVVAGVLGTLTAIMRSNITLAETREVANHTGEAVNKNMLLGGLAGGIIGAAAALVLAPKSGSELMKDIAHTLTHPDELIHPTSSKKSSARTSPRKSSRSNSASSKTKGNEHGESKSAESGKSRKSTSKKKTPPRRRTASTAVKGAVSDKSASGGSDDLEA